MGIQPRKVKHEAEGRPLWWLLMERESAKERMRSFNGASFFDEDQDWCVIAKANANTSVPVCFACVFARDEYFVNEMLTMYVWDDDPKPTVDDVREWFKSTVESLAVEHGRPERDFRQSPGLEDELGEDGRRINPARDAGEAADELYMNSGAAREQDAATGRAARSAVRG